MKPDELARSLNDALKFSSADQSTVEHLLGQLNSPEHAATLAGLPHGDHTFRGVLADALEERGRSEEAAHLREPGRHLVYHNGRLQPNFMERQGTSRTYGGPETGEQFVKPTHDGWKQDEDTDDPHDGHHGFTYWFVEYGIPRKWAQVPSDGGGYRSELQDVGLDPVWWWNPSDGEGLDAQDVAGEHPNYKQYQKTEELGGEPVLMSPAEIAWMKHQAKTRQFKRG